MIYEFVKEQLQTVTGLNGNVFPTGVCIDDIEAPFAVYTLKKRLPVNDLSGELHHYVEEIGVAFLSPLYDELQALYCSAEKILNVSNLDTGHGEYVFSVATESPEMDDFNIDTALLLRTMLVTINWCPV